VGQLSFGASTGIEDINANGTISQNVQVPISGLSLGTGGRGGVQINGTGFVFYVVDASTLVLLNTGASTTHLAGVAYAQSGTFSTNSLGTSAYLVSGVTSGSSPKAYAQIGRFDTNSAGTISSGIFDTNTAAGSSASLQFGASLPYTVASNGRGTFANGTSSFIFWLAVPQGTTTPQGASVPEMGVVMEADQSASPAASGLILQQQTGIPSVTGGFALANSGTDATGATAQASDAQLTVAAFGQSSGTQDINPGGTTAPSSTPVSGASVTISNPTTERGTASIGGSFNVYFVSADRFLMLSSGTTVLSGVAERQCSDCTF
jgi:hypothetical protein